MNKIPSIFGVIPFGFSSQLVKEAIATENLIYEIAAMGQVTPDKVKEFYQSHSYSLEFIKSAILLCGKLDADELEKSLQNQWVNNV